MKASAFSASSIKSFLKKSIGFVTAISKDPRIPAWDKAVLVGLLALVISPVDIIPDFIPVLGQLDDFIVLVVIFDYVFNRIPEEVLLAHFPWDPAGLAAWRRRLRFLSILVPGWARRHIWKIRAGAGGSAEEAAAAAKEKASQPL